MGDKTLHHIKIQVKLGIKVRVEITFVLNFEDICMTYINGDKVQGTNIILEFFKCAVMV